jgi:hypothetical protein
MFDDDMDDWYGAVPKFLVICHSCAHKLLNENPWMKSIVDDHPLSRSERCVGVEKKG